MFIVGMIGGLGYQEVTLLIVIILVLFAALRLARRRASRSASQEETVKGKRPRRSFDVEAFTRAIVSGELRPATVNKTHDKSGPLTIFSFPSQEVAVHVHWNDEERESIGRTEIVKLFTDPEEKISFVDNYALAMLRHYAEGS